MAQYQRHISTDDCPPEFMLAFGEFMTRLRNLDAMTSLKLTFWTEKRAESVIEEFYKLALKSMAAWEVMTPLEGLDDDSILALISYIEFVYLVNRKKHMTLASVTRKALSDFLSGAPAKGELKEILTRRASWNTLNYFYFMLADLRYAGVARPLRFLRQLEPAQGRLDITAQSRARRVPAADIRSAE